MRHVKLSQGKVALVDDADFDLLSQHRWCFGGHYAVRNERIGERKFRRYMHRVLCPSPAGSHVDHIDGNRLNNCRDNLRVVGVGDNVQRAMQRKTPPKSGYRGVHANKLRWGSHIKVNYKDIWLGNFLTPEEAARAYDAAARKHFGPLAYVNFPESRA